jgi:hypothetical protein
MPQVPGVGDHAAPVYEVVSESKIEPKTKAATGGAAAGAITSQFVLWGLDELFWNGDASPEVPLPVAAFVTLAISAGFAFISGYLARHVNR